MSSVGVEKPGISRDLPAEARSHAFSLSTAWRIRPVRSIVCCGILIAAGITGAGFYAWRSGAAEMTGMAMLLSLVIGGMITLCVRQVTFNLNKQRFRLDTALNNMSNGLCMFDAAGVLMLLNARYLEIFNIPAGLIAPGLTLLEMLTRLKQVGIVTGDQDKYIADLKTSLFAGKTTQVLRKLQGDRVISITNRPLPDGGWVATHEDVTELKQREQELRVENMKFDAALQNMSQGLVMFDRDSKLIVCNQKYAEIYGLPPDMIKPGITHTQILEHRIATGIIAPSDVAQYVNDRIAQAKSTKPSDAIIELSDGRTLLIEQRPLANGGCLTTHEDITVRRRAEAKIAHMAHHDVLTDLPNRMRLRERLEDALHHVRRGDQLAVLYLDLDHFKNINDTLGHSVGDELLKKVAERLRSCVCDTDTIARLGGDEFAVIQIGLEQPSDAAMLASRIRDALKEPYMLDGHLVPVDVSIGISIAPNDTVDPDQLLKNADMALYRSKADGRGTFRFFEPEMDERVNARRTLEIDLRNAIVRGEFELYYQPLVNLASNNISACETLLRWHHPTRGMVSPTEFIPTAEETGLINQIGEWVLRQACIEAAGWPDDISVAVNMSPVQFKNQGLAQLVVSALAASGLPGRRLEIEITEALLLQNNDATLATLRQLQELGVRIAMDDFGTGYSSLSYLRSFPFDKIKIDRAFINEIADKDDSSAIVQAVIELAHRLDMTTTAEGVETQGQLEKIQALGCTEMQGYLFSRPLPAKDVVRLFQSGQSDLVRVA
jgi:diguanylate cyclase (GGDEF)-like protein